jgi:purine-binding chemotaxis protein CheW
MATIDLDLEGPAPAAGHHATAAETVAAPRQVVSFMIDDRLYGIDVQSVREIRTWQPVTALPGQPFHTLGVLNIRGEAVPVHDLRARFGGGPTEATPSHVVVIVTVGGTSAGLLVDAVSDIVDIPAGATCPVPEGARDGSDDTVTGLVPRDEKMIALIDVARLI